MVSSAVFFQEGMKELTVRPDGLIRSLALPTMTRTVYPLAVEPKALPSNLVLEKDTIAIYVADNKEPIIAALDEQLRFGRAIDHVVEKNLIDLEPFDGYKYGVSRNHAALVRKNSQLFVHDGGSINGSWLDGQRMKPFELYVVAPGVQLMLGQLPIQLFFSSLSH